LGDGTSGPSNNKSVPTEITSRFTLAAGDKIVVISLGSSHSSAVSSTGRVFTWGFNSSGQLGDSSTTTRLVPKMIYSGVSNFIQTSNLQFGSSILEASLPVENGYSFSGWYEASDLVTPYVFTTMPGRDVNLIAFKSAIPYTITYNLDGGVNNANNPSSYIIEDNVSIFAPTKEGHTFIGWFDDSNLTQAATTTFANTTGNKTYYAKWSVNTYNINYYIADIRELGSATIVLGGSHSAYLYPSGRVFTWGNNSSGQLGDNTTTSKSNPTEITSRFSLAAGDKIVAISLGSSHSSAISSTGRVFTWGSNFGGPLGDGTTDNKSVPTEITSRFSLNAGDKIVSISLGNSYSSAISSTGRVFTWGYNLYGQLGDATTGSSNNKSIPTEITSRFSLAAGDKIVSISLGNSHSSAISSSGRVFTWGYNLDGQLGNATTGSSNNKSIPTEITSRFSLAAEDKIVAISLGSSHSSAISSTGRVFTWGNNTSGQLGDTTTTLRNTPTEITSRFSLAAGDKIVSMSLGSSHSSAISSTGRVFTWGNNFYGQLGDATTGSSNDKSIPTEITSRFSLAAGDKIVSLSLGQSHSSAISSTGRVFTWGSNSSGRLGDGNTTDRLIPTEITSRISLFAGVLVQTISVPYLSSISAESLPSTTGYSYSSWYEASDLVNPYVFTTMPSRDLNLYSFKTPND
jgi:uncharacterized repeat protein (TIGR02543 family)